MAAWTGASCSAVHRELIVALAARHKLPTIYFEPLLCHRRWTGLLWAEFRDQIGSAAGYVDASSEGEKPADLPVQAPTNISSMINLKTAKRSGLTIRGRVLATRRRGDRVVGQCPLLAQSGHGWCSAHVRFRG